MATVDTLITAEGFFLLPDDGRPSELVRGRIVYMNMPGFRHGRVCVRVVWIVSNHVIPREIGRVVSNDSGVQTEHDPDTVRGADVAYYSFSRLPPDQDPSGYPEVSPEIVFEVLSPSDRWSEIQGKVGEYLSAKVVTVCVLDPELETIIVYHADRPPQTLHGDDELTFPGVLDEFRVRVRTFFE